MTIKPTAAWARVDAGVLHPRFNPRRERMSKPRNARDRSGHSGQCGSVAVCRVPSSGNPGQSRDKSSSMKLGVSRLSRAVPTYLRRPQQWVDSLKTGSREIPSSRSSPSRIWRSPSRTSRRRHLRITRLIRPAVKSEVLLATAYWRLREAQRTEGDPADSRVDSRLALPGGQSVHGGGRQDP